MELTVSVEQAAEILGCGRSTVFVLLSNGTLERAVRRGRRLRILRESVERAAVTEGKRPPRRRRQRPFTPARLENIPI